MKKLLAIVLTIIMVLSIAPMTFALDVHTHSVSTTCSEQDGQKLFLPLTQDMIDAMDGYWFTIYDANYYLAEDIVLPNYIVVRMNSTLCLNGHTITGTKEGKSGHIMPNIDVGEGSTLNLCDCKGGGKIIGTGKGANTGILLRNNTTLNLYGGNIYIDSETSISGIYATQGSVLNMYGGTVYSALSGITATEGSETLNLYGGKVGGDYKIVFLSDDTVLNDAADVLCGCMCHKDGIMSFIWKIINLFQRILGINPVCECAKAHY